MTAVSKDVIGKWRIHEADLWETKDLDLVEPAFIRFDANGRGEFMFICVSGGMDVGYNAARDDADFTWAGFDEMDEASGSGNAKLGDDDILTIELKFHLGDEAIMKAKRW